MKGQNNFILTFLVFNNSVMLDFFYETFDLKCVLYT